MTAKEPIRFSALESQPDLARTLRAAKERCTDDATVARLAARLGLAPTLPPPPPRSVSASPGSAATAGVVAKTGIAIAVLVATGAGIWAWAEHSPARIPVIPPPVASSILPARSLVVTPSLTGSEAPQVAPSTSAPASVSSGISSFAPKPTEISLVTGAERAVRTDPARALFLTEEHRRLYPTGELSEEREVLAIEALASLGRAKAALARADRFRAVHPASPYLGRIARAVGSDGHRAGANTDAGSVQKK